MELRTQVKDRFATFVCRAVCVTMGQTVTEHGYFHLAPNSTDLR